MTTRAQLKKGRILYCIECGRKLSKKEAARVKKEKQDRNSVSKRHKKCCGMTRGYRCDDCLKTGNWIFTPTFKERHGWINVHET